MKKSFSVIALMGVMGVLLGGRVSALTYQDDVNVQFTFNPAIRIDLSDSELLVSNLAPGAASDSNIITVSAATNASYGYQLSATVGTKGGTDALVNTLDNTKTFANLTATKAGLVDFGDNTWGYSYCADTSANCGTGGTSSWVSGSVGETTAGYGGLPLDDNDDASLRGQGGVTLISTTGDGDNSSVVQFKIGAKAGTNQVAGTYNNTINFYAVANPEPEPAPGLCTDTATCMQTMTLSDCPTTPTNMTDARDGQTYKVAKLADGKCWMVENLNLAGDTALDADKTDVTSAYISSFETSNNLTKNGNTIVLPTSSTSGFDTNNYSYVYNSGNKENCGASGQNTPCYSYYSWDAATLGSGRTIGTDNTDAEQSICPKGWKLPTSRTIADANWQTTSDFYAMAHQYGLDSTTSISEKDADFFNQAGPSTTPNFLLAGYYNYGSFYNGGGHGYYLSSTSDSNAYYARNLYFYSSSVDSASNYFRFGGYSVRCMLGS